MKKFIKLFKLFLLPAIMLTGLVSCGDDTYDNNYDDSYNNNYDDSSLNVDNSSIQSDDGNNGGGYYDPSFDDVDEDSMPTHSENIVSIDELTFGTCSYNEELGKENDDYSDNTVFEFGLSYILKLKFKVTSNFDNSQFGRTFKADLKIENAINVFSASWHYVDTSNIETQLSDISETGSANSHFIAEFKAPNVGDEIREIQFNIKISPNGVGDAPISFGFRSSSISITGYGSNGLTRSISVRPYKIETPVIYFNNQISQIRWNHVKLADYYLFYKDDEMVKDPNTGKALRYTPDVYVEVGKEVGVDIALLSITEPSIIKIQAVGERSGVNPSNYSNEIVVL